MQFQCINPGTDPEKVFLVVKNTHSTSAITVGQPVCWDYTTDADGVGVCKPTAALARLTAGVVESTSIASGSAGLIQVFGHNANALVDGSSGLAVGMPLLPGTTFTLIRMTTALDTFANAASFVFTAAQAYSSGAAAAKKVFIRAL